MTNKMHIIGVDDLEKTVEIFRKSICLFAKISAMNAENNIRKSLDQSMAYNSMDYFCVIDDSNLDKENNNE